MNTMTKEETTAFASAIATALKSEVKPPNDGRFIDMSFKALSALSMLLVVYIFNSVNILKEDNSNMKKDNQYLIKMVEKNDDFASKPRFTKEDFDIHITPLVNQMNKNTIELNTRSTFIETTQNRLLKLEYNVEELNSKKLK